MIGKVLLAWRLLVGSAMAAEPVGESAHQGAVAPGAESAAAGPFSGGRGPAETVQDEVEEKKSKEQLEMEARIAAIEEANKGKAARVVVLQWKGTDTTYKNENLQRNVRSRINRPDSNFYPDVDLYQSGRKEPDATIRPIDQRAIVPDSAIDALLDAADEVSTIPWNALSENDWGLRAQELLRLSNEVWFIDRPELREPLFMLYSQIGRAAENANQGSPPFYAEVRGRTVNYYWYLAAALAHRDPALMSKITEADLNTSITYLKDQIDSGSFEPMQLSFDDEGRDFDPKAFTEEYILFVDGMEDRITDPDGLYEVPPGRADVYLRRTDGHSLSDRIENDRMKDKFYFVRQNARKRMGLDFIEQLMENPYECIPAIDGDILNYLSIYQRLHPRADIYIVVPFAGSTAPGRLYLWRWDREQAHLVRVQDNTGGFPIRFAALMSLGIAFGTVDYEAPANEELEATLESQEPGAPLNLAQPIDQFAELAPRIDGFPLDFQLRGHYNRLMMAVGLQYKIGTGDVDNPSFADAYQTDEFSALTTIEVDCDPLAPECGTDGKRVAQVLALRERRIQRLVYSTIGVVLGRDAGSGFGPRGYLRFGWTNAPHAVDMTAHAGYTARIGGGDDKAEIKDEERGGRVRAILDLDFFGGMLLPYRNSIYMISRTELERQGKSGFMRVGAPFATFGFSAGAGLTF